MHRICGSLAANGYEVVLVGRNLKTSIPLEQRNFIQKRIRCIFNRGAAFYAEYNLRLFFFLLFKKIDGICAIDLDTILPCTFISKLKGIPGIYDAHEYFTELKEVMARPKIQKFWKRIEKISVPKFQYGYTVSPGIAEEFKKKYGCNYEVIRNLPVLKPLESNSASEQTLLYQGAVNEGRGFEYLIPAMKHIPYKLIICGDGNFMGKLKQLIKDAGVENRIELKGMLPPAQLWEEAQNATLAVGLAEKEGLNQYLALPNKFFEYMHSILPQLAMNFPEYKKINIHFEVAVLIDELTTGGIAAVINRIMKDDVLLSRLKKNCIEARKIYCWQNEEKKLIHFYDQIFKA